MSAARKIEKISIIDTDTAGNDFSVPQKQWRKWSDKQRTMFNVMYLSMTDDPKLFQHPDTTVGYEQWKTVAWNAAWTAADMLKKHIL